MRLFWLYLLAQRKLFLGIALVTNSFHTWLGTVPKNPLFTSYHCCTYGDSYLEVLKTFADETVKAVHSLEQELAAEKMVSDNQHPFNTKRCLETDGCHLAIPSDEFFQKVIVIKPKVLKPEFQLPTRQLYVCTGGFGAYPKSRGSACFCTSLYSGKHTRFRTRRYSGHNGYKSRPPMGPGKSTQSTLRGEETEPEKGGCTIMDF